MLNENEMPLGLGMALAQNMAAMKYFVSLSDDRQRKIIRETHAIGSNEQMQRFVSSLAAKDTSSLT